MKKYIGLFLLSLSLVSGAYARPFISIEGGIAGAYSGETKRISTAEYGYYEDIKGAEITYGVPFTISIGYLKEERFGDGFGVSVFYTKNIVSDTTAKTIETDYDFSKTYLPSDDIVQITSQQAGIGLTYKPDSSFAINLGVSKDIGSKVVYAIKNTEIERKLNGTYMPLSIDWGQHFDNFGLYCTLGTQLHLSGDEYVSNGFFIGLKVQYLISW